MRSLLFTAAVALLLTGTGTLWADPPEIEPWTRIQDSGTDLLVNLYSIPTCVDWNNDGAKDLLVGQIYYGWIWLYLNEGTDLNPVFNGGTLVESSGSPITLSWG